MARGGQGGMGWLLENNLLNIILAVSLFFALQLLAGCISGVGRDAPKDPMAKYDHDCRQEYADKNDGNPETKVETEILLEFDCAQEIAAMKAERQQDYEDQLQEAQTP